LCCAACAGGPNSAVQEAFPYRRLSDRNTPFLYAVQAAERVPDRISRLFLYTSIASGYRQANRPRDARSVLEHVVASLQDVRSAGSRAQIMLDVARQYVLLDDPELAVGLMNQALDLSGMIDGDWNKGILYEEIIQTCFLGGPDTYSVLIRTVDRTLILDDLWTRVSILTNTARRYQRSGLGQSVNALVQQAIPAAGSLENPWQRAVSFTEIAAIFSAAGESRSADGRSTDGRGESNRNVENNIRRAVAEIDAVTVLALSEEDARRILRISRNLADLSRFDAALDVLEVISAPHLRAEGTAVLGSILGRRGDRQGAFLFLSRAAREVAFSDAPAFQASVYTDLATRYLALNESELALLHAGYAEAALERVRDEYAASDILIDLAPVYLGRVPESEYLAVADSIRDGYVRSTVRTAYARHATDAGLTVQAVEILEQAVLDARSAEYLQDELLSSIAAEFAQAGRFDRALETAREIGTPFALSRALIGIGTAASDPDGIAGEYRDILREIGSLVREM
jgi:tetratricopeptide (TPR) repeat protein